MLRVSASVHYFRTPRESWELVLDRLLAAGISGVDVYIPWSVHEVEPGRFDFGETNPILDASRFLDLVRERRMWAILRPGPQVNAELNNFGLPDRVVRDPRMQAQSPRGKPVFCTSPPVFFPVPSYASEAYLDEAARWFRAAGEALSHHLGPEGPVRMVQVDNEAALFFRDAPFDQDYRPEAAALYGRWLEERGMARRDPPFRREPGREGLVTITSWVRFRQWMVVRALRRMRSDMEQAGLGGRTWMHNCPPSGLWPMLRPSRLEEVVDVVATDVYASARKHGNVVDQILALRGLGQRPFSAELGCGTVFFAPRIGGFDNRLVTLVALAHGLAGYNLYMGAGRDRWLGGLIPDGRPETGADLLHFHQRLAAVLEGIRHHELVPLAPAAVVAPDEYADHSVAAMPLPGGAISLMAALGLPVTEMLVGDDWDLGIDVQRRWITRFRTAQSALVSVGLPYVICHGRRPYEEGQLVIAPTYPYLSQEVVERLLAHVESGGRVVAGPLEPTMDERLEPLPDALRDRFAAARDTGRLTMAQEISDRAVLDVLRDAAREAAERLPWETSIRAPSLTVLPHRSEDSRTWACWLVSSAGGAGQRTVFKVRKGWECTRLLALSEGRTGDEFVHETFGEGAEITLDVTGRQVHLLVWRRLDVQ